MGKKTQRRGKPSRRTRTTAAVAAAHHRRVQRSGHAANHIPPASRRRNPPSSLIPRDIDWRQLRCNPLIIYQVPFCFLTANWNTNGWELFRLWFNSLEVVIDFSLRMVWKSMPSAVRKTWIKAARYLHVDSEHSQAGLPVENQMSLLPSMAYRLESFITSAIFYYFAQGMPGMVDCFLNGTSSNHASNYSRIIWPPPISFTPQHSLNVSAAPSYHSLASSFSGLGASTLSLPSYPQAMQHQVIMNSNNEGTKLVWVDAADCPEVEMVDAVSTPSTVADFPLLLPPPVVASPLKQSSSPNTVFNPPTTTAQPAPTSIAPTALMPATPSVLPAPSTDTPSTFSSLTNASTTGVASTLSTTSFPINTNFDRPRTRSRNLATRGGRPFPTGLNREATVFLNQATAGVDNQGSRALSWSAETALVGSQVGIPASGNGARSSLKRGRSEPPQP